MKKQEYLSREQRLKDYTTVANFLMSGNSKEVKVFAERLNWKKFTEDCCQFMDIKFIRKYKDYINWNVYITEIEDIPIDFLKEFVDYIDWKYYTIQKDLPIDVIREFKDYIDWEIYTSDVVYLSEDFIREFADYVDWEFLANSYNFSDEFREEFKEYLEKTE
jgi:hypothetical protein